MPVAQNENQAVLDLLQNFNGPPSLKKLQAHLNMDREDAPISRREWKEAHQTLLATDPVITASVGGSARELFREEQSFKVIYCRLASPELFLTHERAVVTELLGQYPYALFVFSDQAQKRFHFLNVKDEPQGQKRRLFRRITVGDGERLRTAAEQLAKLDGEVLKHLPLSGIQARFDEAFDVGPVTKRFFAEYKRIFELVKAGIQGFAADPAGEEARNLFTQRLFNRLMFLAFIQKKGWLKYGGNEDYLCTLWTAHQRDTFANKGSFYEGRLKPLFFLGLNTGPSEVNLVGINRGGGLTELIGDVPYLNGGLFEKDADDDNSQIKVPDAGLDAVINDLFEKFNFTITESTPLDIEVAVDPEMLGKIFERLVTGRHESGSYYTPKPIVSFMCREALKGHLESRVPDEPKDKIVRFVDNHDGAVDHPEEILDALRTVTICDPACGSGAYLLGMLHELLDLRQCLFASRHIDARSVYDRKLEIIQKSIYGVDLDPFAVNIARLRLWLSLSVDFQGPVPLPLPNLDYKLSRGDSLTAPLTKGASQQSSFAAEAISEFLAFKERHFNAHQQDKITLKQQAEEKRKEVASWVWGSTHVLGFDWSVMYAEVFAVDGFDIILANPPYVRADAKFKHIEDENLRREAVQQWAKYRAALIRSGQYETLVEKWDLYIAFLERSMRLLKQGGLMAFIIPDAYNSNKYAEASHDFFLEGATVRRIDFCSDVDIFDAGVSNTILLFRSGVLPGTIPLRALHRSPDIERFNSDFVLLESTSQTLMGTSLFRPQKRSDAVTFEHVALSNICYISKGMVLHAHETKAPNEFIAEALISRTKDAKHPKAYVEGKDVQRWFTSVSQYLEYGTQRSPAKLSRPTFPEMYDVPSKLISMDIASQQLRVTLDEAQLYHNHSAWSFVPWHALKGIRNRSIRKTALYESEVTAATMPLITRDELEKTSRAFDIAYLSAIMNSSFAQQWLSGERRNKLHLYPDDWKLLPIPVASPAEQAGIHNMVMALRSSLENGSDHSKVAALEQQLDAAVDTLVARTPS